MAVRHSNLDFHSIERALSVSMEALEGDGSEQLSSSALEQLAIAQEEWKRALSFSMSRGNR